MYRYNFNLLEDNTDDILQNQFFNNSKQLPITKLFCLNNFYCQGVQAGIQSAHSLGELSSKYLVQNKSDNNETLNLVKKYLSVDKTMVVLNGGAQSNLFDFLDYLESNDIKYPYAPFFEEQDALNNSLTNISVIFPEQLFSWEVRSIFDIYKNKTRKNISVPIEVEDYIFKDIGLLINGMDYANKEFLEKNYGSNKKIFKQYDNIKNNMAKVFTKDTLDTSIIIILMDRFYILSKKDLELINKTYKLRTM